MRCFIHTDIEAVAVCLSCGKAMCIDCSGLDSHSGRCPNCRARETEKKIKTVRPRKRANFAKFVLYFLFAAAFITATVLMALMLLPDLPSLDMGLPFIETMLDWKFVFRVLIVCAPALVGFIFFICMLVVLCRAVSAARRLRKLEEDLTEINLNMNRSRPMESYTYDND